MNNQQTVKMDQQAGELEELGKKHQYRAIRIQRLEDTIRQKVDRIEQSDSRSQQLHRDNTDIRSSKEQLQNLFRQEALRRLGEILASALLSKSTTNNLSDQQFAPSQDGSSDHLSYDTDGAAPSNHGKA